MKKCLVFVGLLFSVLRLAAVAPMFFGARSLALGFSSLAFAYDINAVYLNAAILALVPISATGLQYQESNTDYRNFIDNLEQLPLSDLRNFQGLSSERREEVLGKLREIFDAKAGIHGFHQKNPGYVGKGYGTAIALIKSAIIVPDIETDTREMLNKPAAEISNEDIASLKMKCLGLDYTKYTVSYGVPLTQNFSAGISGHLMTGKIGESDVALVDDEFRNNSSARDFLQFSWDKAEQKFTKLNFDLFFAMDFGENLKLGVSFRNMGKPTLQTGARAITLGRRITAGAAFQPGAGFGIFLDVDFSQNDFFFNGNKTQPIALGVEKALFKNRLYLRAGFNNDLTEKYFFGFRSAILYGLGFGFNISRFALDVAFALDHAAHVKNLAVTGYYFIGQQN